MADLNWLKSGIGKAADYDARINGFVQKQVGRLPAPVRKPVGYVAKHARRGGVIGLAGNLVGAGISYGATPYSTRDNIGDAIAAASTGAGIGFGVGGGYGALAGASAGLYGAGLLEDYRLDQWNNGASGRRGASGTFGTPTPKAPYQGRDVFGDYMRRKNANQAPLDPAPSRPGYDELTGGYQPDQAYASTVRAAQRGIAGELAGIEQTRKAREQEIRSRYNLTGPTAQEKEALNLEIQQNNTGAKRAGDAIQRNYGAATNEAKAQYGVAAQLAANTSGNIQKFYDAAATNTQAQNAAAFGVAAAGTTGLGLGNTVLGGEATLIPEAIRFEGMREGASAADDAAVRRDDIAFLRDSLAAESADQSADVYRAEQDANVAARLASNNAVQNRINAQTSEMYGALDNNNQGFDTRRYSLQDQGRGLDLDYAKSEASNRQSYLADRTGYQTANAIQDYEDQVAQWQARQATSGTGSRNLAGLLAGVPSKLVPADELGGNASFGRASLYDQQDVMSSFLANVGAAAASSTDKATRVQNIQAVLDAQDGPSAAFIRARLAQKGWEYNPYSLADRL